MHVLNCSSGDWKPNMYWFVALPRHVMLKAYTRCVNHSQVHRETVIWLTAISRNLPCILSMISGARHKRVSNLVYYSLPNLCTFEVLANTAKITSINL